MVNVSRNQLWAIAVCVTALGLSGCKSGMGALSDLREKIAPKEKPSQQAQLETCEEPLGTLRFNERHDLSWWRAYNAEYPRLGSIVPLMRTLVQESNCFLIVEQVAGVQSIPVQYTLIPSVKLAGEATTLKEEGNSLLGKVGSFLGNASKTQDNVASTSLLLVENRTGVQVASATGTAEDSKFTFFGMSLDEAEENQVDPFNQSAEGRMIADAFASSYNQMVKVARNFTPSEIPVATRAEPEPVQSTSIETRRVKVVPSPTHVNTAPSQTNIEVVRSSGPIYVDDFDEEALNEYYDNLKSSIEFLSGIGSVSPQQLNTMGGNGSNIGSQVWMAWSIYVGKMESAKIEIETWPEDAKRQGWDILGSKINKYNKLFNKRRENILANSSAEERLLTSLRNVELLTEASLFAD